jgi:hypothetical protein
MAAVPSHGNRLDFRTDMAIADDPDVQSGIFDDSPGALGIRCSYIPASVSVIICDGWSLWKPSETIRLDT